MEKSILRAYFDSCPISNKKEELNNREIIALLNKHGCNVTQMVMGIDLPYLDKQSGEAAANIYASKLRDIRETDVFVCEMTYVSASIIFEIYEALNQKKPVLVLVSEQNQEALDIALLGNPSDLLFVEVYSEKKLEEIITRFLKKARKKIPVSRFTVRLTQEMGDYLNHLKGKLGCSSKNEVVVNLLEEMMREDKDFLSDYR